MTNYHPQDLHSNTPPARDEADAWRSALIEAFEGGAGEGGKTLIAQGFVSLLGEVGSQMVAGGVIGFILPLLRRLFDQSDAIARRFNPILDEPFLTVARALRDIASVEIRSLDELREWQRQLAVAFDSFARGRTYAEMHALDRVQLITFYQSLTAALMPGGRPFAELYLVQLRGGVAELRAEADRLQKGADATRP
jgi:hypothetical protein